MIPFALTDEGSVCFCRHQLLEFCRIRDFHFDDPTCAIGVVIDRLWRVFERLVELGDNTRKWAE
jgi:hypothetical protein